MPDHGDDSSGPSSGGAAGRTVLWLTDGRVPPVREVTAFRRDLVAAFTAAGGVVSTATLSPAATPPAATSSPAPDDDDVLAAASEADVVVCETPRVAFDAVRRGIPRERTWVHVLPSVVSVSGEPFRLGVPLLRVGPRVRGLLTDTETSRESLERAFDEHPLEVLVLPPAGAGAAGAGAGTRGEAPADASQVAPTDVRDLLRRLARWYPAGPADDEETPPSPAPVPTDTWPDAPTTALDPGPAPSAVTAPHDAARVAGRVLGSTPARAVADRPMVGVVGYDHRFFRVLARRLRARGEVDLRTDEWRSPGQRNRGSVSLARRADVLVAEWARPNAIWLSRRKRPDQFLVLRLHRFEVDSHFPADIDIDAVDAVVHVGPEMGRRIRDRLGWPADRLVYIPNLVDVDAFERPKLAGARFTLGMVGAAPLIKRLDLALDVLRAVRAEDPRFTLVVRTQLPWDNRFVWGDAGQRSYWRRCLRRMETDPLLRGAVQLSAAGTDMPRWFRGVGHVLSLSDDESFHCVLAEGMASGAVPVLRPWPGSEHLWDRAWALASVHEAAAWVLSGADRATWAQRSARARREVASSFDPARVVAAWSDLLGRDRDAASRHFRDPLR